MFIELQPNLLVNLDQIVSVQFYRKEAVPALAPNVELGRSPIVSASVKLSNGDGPISVEEAAAQKLNEYLEHNEHIVK